jgi:hypothetical protein
MSKQMVPAVIDPKTGKQLVLPKLKKPKPGAVNPGKRPLVPIGKPISNQIGFVGPKPVKQKRPRRYTQMPDTISAMPQTKFTPRNNAGITGPGGASVNKIYNTY